YYSNLINTNNLDIDTGKYSIKQLLDSIINPQSVKYLQKENLVILSPKKNEPSLKHFIVEGSIITKNGKQVPFASIYFLNQAIGTLANSEGKFKFTIPDSLVGNPLLVSAMGYEIKQVPWSVYNKGKVEVTLHSQKIPIKYIVIRPSDPYKIVQQAIQAKNKNYPKKENLLLGFFRESNMQDNKYIALNEAAVEVFKRPVSSLRNDLIRVTKGRKGENVENSKELKLTVKGGLYNALQLDIVKHEVPFFSNLSNEEYKFWVEKSTIYRGRPTYVIGFNSLYPSEEISYKGKLLIDAETLALSRCEFELNPEGIKYASGLLISYISNNYKAWLLHAKYEVDYRYYNQKWHLSHTKGEVKFKVKNRRKTRKTKNYSCEFVSTSELAITGISNGKEIKFRDRESSGIKDVFVEQIEALSNDFWKGNNVILPEEPLLKTLEDLQMKGIIGSDHIFISSEDKDSLM
ncbi:MAG: carboxypeptidase-like regulatory domain-containing protein, partial [Bacteroidales bacterium]|nr:carboxypeptidase-like regulatory domain-containing protein [Bacteroidales bacterium]